MRNDQTLIVAKDDIVEARDHDLTCPDDLLSVQNLHEATILHILRKRLSRHQAYVRATHPRLSLSLTLAIQARIGPLVVFMNPYTTSGFADDDELLQTMLADPVARADVRCAS